MPEQAQTERDKLPKLREQQEQDAALAGPDRERLRGEPYLHGLVDLFQYTVAAEGPRN